MAKLHGAAKRAFLARMARGRKKHARRVSRKNPRRAAKRRNPLYARHGIDRNERIYPSMVKRTPNPRRKRRKSRRRTSARRVRRVSNPIAYLVNPSPTGGKSMARKRRKSRRTRKHARRHTRRRNPMIRRRRHSRRRRNPGLLGKVLPSGGLKGALMPAAGALAGGFVGGLVEAKTSSMNPIVSKAIQVGVGLIGGGIAAKVGKSSTVGAAFTGAVLGGLTRRLGEKAGGGVASIENMEHIAALAATEDNYGVLLQQGMSGMGLILAPMNGGLGDGSTTQLDAALSGDDE